MSEISAASFIVISAVLTTIVVCTFVGNFFVIMAILLDKNLQTTANQLVLSLAVADLMVACLVMPLGAYNDLYQGWYLGKEVCEFWTSADVLCCTASILNLLAIALDRYWAVTNVDYIYRRTRQRVNTMILCVWLVGAIVSLAPIFGWKDPDFANRVLVEHKCMVSQDVAYQVFATISTFYAPLVLLLALYWRIFQVARKRIRRKPGGRTQLQQVGGLVSVAPTSKPIGPSNKERASESNGRVISATCTNLGPNQANGNRDKEKGENGGKGKEDKSSFSNNFGGDNTNCSLELVVLPSNSPLVSEQEVDKRMKMMKNNYKSGEQQPYGENPLISKVEEEAEEEEEMKKMKQTTSLSSSSSPLTNTNNKCNHNTQQTIELQTQLLPMNQQANKIQRRRNKTNEVSLCSFETTSNNNDKLSCPNSTVKSPPDIPSVNCTSVGIGKGKGKGKREGEGNSSAAFANQLFSGARIVQMDKGKKLMFREEGILSTSAERELNLCSTNGFRNETSGSGFENCFDEDTNVLKVKTCTKLEEKFCDRITLELSNGFGANFNDTSTFKASAASVSSAADDDLDDDQRQRSSIERNRLLVSQQSRKRDDEADEYELCSHAVSGQNQPPGRRTLASDNNDDDDDDESLPAFSSQQSQKRESLALDCTVEDLGLNSIKQKQMNKKKDGGKMNDNDNNNNNNNNNEAQGGSNIRDKRKRVAEHNVADRLLKASFIPLQKALSSAPVKHRVLKLTENVSENATSSSGKESNQLKIDTNNNCCCCYCACTIEEKSTHNTCSMPLISSSTNYCAQCCCLIAQQNTPNSSKQHHRCGGKVSLDSISTNKPPTTIGFDCNSTIKTTNCDDSISTTSTSSSSSSSASSTTSTSSTTSYSLNCNNSNSGVKVNDAHAKIQNLGGGNLTGSGDHDNFDLSQDDDEESVASLSAAFPPPIELATRPTSSSASINPSIKFNTTGRQQCDKSFESLEVGALLLDQTQQKHKPLDDGLKSTTSKIRVSSTGTGAGAGAGEGRKVWPTEEQISQISMSLQQPEVVAENCFVGFRTQTQKQNSHKNLLANENNHHHHLDFRRRFRVLGQLVSFVQISKNFNSSSSAAETSQSNSTNEDEDYSMEQQQTRQISFVCDQSQRNSIWPNDKVEKSTQQEQVTHSGTLISSRCNHDERERIKTDDIESFGGFKVEGSIVKNSVSSPTDVRDENLFKNKPHLLVVSEEHKQPELSKLAHHQNRQVTLAPIFKSEGETMSTSAGSQVSARRRADIKREKKAAKTLAIITGVFVCCWLPFFLNAIIMPICGPSCTPSDLILSILLWLGYLNSLLNPIIYTIFSPDFRLAFRRLLCWPPMSLASSVSSR